MLVKTAGSCAFHSTVINKNKRHMKKINCFFSAFVLLIVLVVSCKKDVEAPPSPVESLKAFSGRNRALVEFQAPEGAVKGKVFYNNGEFKEFDISGSSQSVIVEDLAEQQEEHIIRVVTINGEGTVSNPKAVKVRVYGDTYEKALKPRKWIDQVVKGANTIELVFDPSLPGETTLRVVYTTVSGGKDSVDVSPGTNTILLNNINTDGDYFYYSVYKPEPNSIDQYYSESLDIKTAIMMDFQKEKWVIDGFSGQDTEHNSANLIDNSSATSWRTNAGTAGSRWITVDMDNPKVVDGFYYLKEPGNDFAPKQIKIEASLDNSSWTTVLEATVSESFLRQQLPLPQRVTARYFRITVVSTVTANAQQAEITEIDAYNTLNISGNNGYTQSTPVSLVNAKAPFTGDGSNLLPAVGDYRMQKVSGWTHTNANISFDNSTRTMNPFSAAVWGAPAVTNGKILLSQ